MSKYCIELNNITKRFSKFTAVTNFSIQLVPGKIYGFIGPNGAGKTTTMSMIMGTLAPTSGDGFIMGHPLGSKEAIASLGYSPEFTSFYSDMSCMEYLWYMAKLGGLDDDTAFKRAAELIKQFNLTADAKRKVAKFSTGMKKKVSLAQAMIHNPKILLLDEPTANLDPTSRYEILEIVKNMVEKNNLTVLISSHVLTELETIIDHVIMIQHGKLILNDDIHAVQKKFKQGILLVNTSDNSVLIEKLKDKYTYELSEDHVRFTTNEMANLKKEVVNIVYKQKLSLDLLQEEVISLETLYQQIISQEGK